MRIYSCLGKIAVTTLALLLCVCCKNSEAQQPPPVSVKVYKQDLGNSVSYHYRVINNSADAKITAINVGYDYYHGIPELQTLPVGVSVAGSLPQGSATSPAGWAASVNFTEETNEVDIQWNITSPGAALVPGQSLSGFSVTVPHADSSYETGHWTASLNGGTSAAYSWSLSPDAACSTPTLSIFLTPDVLWPPNHKVVEIKANLSVQDESDPSPSVILQSINANEDLQPGDISAQLGTSATTFSVKSERKGNNKAGRVYTVTYQATNYCGNSAVASARVTVPHDRR